MHTHTHTPTHTYLAAILLIFYIAIGTDKDIRSQWQSLVILCAYKCGRKVQCKDILLMFVALYRLLILCSCT